MNRTLFALALLLPSAGCVSASKLKTTEAAAADSRQLAVSLSNDLNASRAETMSLKAAVAAGKAQAEALSKSEADLRAKAAEAEADAKAKLAAVEADRKTKVAEVEAKLASSADQVASLQKSNKDLQQSLEANKGELSKKVAELVKEKDAVGQRLASAEKTAAESKAAKEGEAAGLAAKLKDAEGRLAELQKAKDGLEGAKAALEADKAGLQKQKADEVAAVKKSYEDIAAGLKAEISAGEVTISSLKGKLTVNMVDRILFDSGSADVKPAGKKVLAHVGEILNQVKDKDIRIEGHTDNVPITEALRGRYASNWELSTARATAVARYLEDHAKVDPTRLVAAGLGQWRPVAPNDKPENKALNRRIEIILVPRD